MDRKIRYFVNGWSFRLSFATRPGYDGDHEDMHALFLLEDRFGIEPCVDGSIRFTNEAIQSCVCTWRSWKEFLEEGKITREEYEDKKDGLVG